MFGTDVTVLDEEVLREDLRLDVRDGLEWVLGVEWTDVEEEEAEEEEGYGASAEGRGHPGSRDLKHLGPLHDFGSADHDRNADHGTHD